MNNFNKLYNLILESIISQNKQYRKNILAKSNLSDKRKEQIMYFLIIMDNKIADFLVKYFADGTLTSTLDERIQDVNHILKLQPSIDTQSWKGTLDQFIKKYYNLIKAKKQKEASKDIQQLDKISAFSQKKEYPNDVIIYKVDEDKEAMMAVRKVVDDQWGEDANPWCLIARKNGRMDQAWDMWRRYSAFPKHIAFQHGLLLAFCADSSGNCTWWDRNDQSTSKLKLLDRNYMQTDSYEWEEGYTDQRFFENHPELKYNNKTGMYDVNGSIKIVDIDMINGHIPVKLGVVTGNFDLDASECTSLQNCPEEVYGDCYLYGYFKDLRDCPKKIGGWLSIMDTVLRSLQGCPQELKGFRLNCNWIHDLKNGPKIVKKFMEVESFSLESLEGCPEEIGGDFRVSHGHIKTLIGGPKRVGGQYYLYDCPDLLSTKGCPEECEFFNIRHLPKTTEINELPKKVAVVYVNCNATVPEEFKKNYDIRW